MMEESYSESDVSMSPSKILEKLQMLRQWQLLQRGKLQKHQLQYNDSPEISSNITEIVSHFSDSTSYNTFRSLLQSSHSETNTLTSRLKSNESVKESLDNIIEGVSVLNSSEGSEYIINSPISAQSGVSISDKIEQAHNIDLSQKSDKDLIDKKQISLDEMPILSPKKDFETLITEKLQSEQVSAEEKNVPPSKNSKTNKKPFLRRGEGIARFGLQKNDFVIQNTQSLPWRKKDGVYKPTGRAKEKIKNVDMPKKHINVQIIEDKSKAPSPLTKCNLSSLNIQVNKDTIQSKQYILEQEKISDVSEHKENTKKKLNPKNKNILKQHHPLQTKKGKTWASVLSKEQDDFLRQLKQSEYYKNFISPSKSIDSNASCSENTLKQLQEKEIAEQNMFELIENKVSHESFNMDNSFFNRFIRKSYLEGSGESTPLVMQKCLSKNPNLLHIQPDIAHKRRNENSCSDAETCDSEYTDYSETCSTECSCCSCKTVTQSNLSVMCTQTDKNQEKVSKQKGDEKRYSVNDKKAEQCHNDKVSATNEMNVNMAEMNTKLIATSELLKDRLRELEDEIETFRKENANLTKMREEIDTERQKFYEEKATFEQKFNEEKILSEFYIAEEKEKINKQKQMYERYVRDMRGRLNKKEKDEVVTLKKEIHDLKEEIKLKDAKSTSTIAKLRNQLKIIEKEKKTLESEVEKLKKENRRIQHSNDITRRLTNLKYLEEINQKLSSLASKDNQSDVCVDANVKYKTFEIENQSRNKKKQFETKGKIRQRAKSVPNLNVTSRYAKYFSQKDSLSDKAKNKTLNCDIADMYHSDIALDNSNGEISNLDNSNISKSDTDDEDENKLEKVYNERFKSISSNGNRSNKTSPRISEHEDMNNYERINDFFIRKSNENMKQQHTTHNIPLTRSSLSPYQYDSNDSFSSTSKSPLTLKSNRGSSDNKSPPSHFSKQSEFTSGFQSGSNHRPKSPISILSNRSSVINKELNLDARMNLTPEPPLTKTSLSKSNLNPIEIKKPDGTKELRFPNGNVKIVSADGQYSKFIYYNGDVKENFYNEGMIKYFYAETKTYHTTYPDGLEILEFPDGQVEKRYKDGSSEIRLPNGSIRYFDPKNEHIREEWRFPDGAALTVSSSGEKRIVFANGQVEVHAQDHKRREFPDGTVKLVYNDGTSETRYASGRVRIKDKHGNLIMDSAPG